MDNDDKEKKSKYKRDYYLKHRDEIIEKTKKYISENPEKHKESLKKYSKEHREERNAYYRDYYQLHKEEKKAKQIKYYQDNKEERKAYYHEYYAQNKDKYSASSKAYRDEHKEELSKKSKEYYQEHREELIAKRSAYQKEHYKEYQEKNKEKLKEYYHENIIARTKKKNIDRLLKYAFVNGYEDDSIEGKIIGCSYNDAISLFKYDYKERYGTSFDGNFDNVFIEHLFPLNWTMDENEIFLLNGIWNLAIIKPEDHDSKRRIGYYRDNNHPVWSIYETKLDFDNIMNNLNDRVKEVYPRTRTKKN